MSGVLIVNEFAKMKRLRTGWAAAALAVATVGLTVASAASSPLFSQGEQEWVVLMAGMALAFPVCSPLLLAVLASRQVDIEHQGNGWLFFHTSGVSPGTLCRVKLVTSGIAAASATCGASLAVLGFGFLVGVSGPVPWTLWAGYTGCIVVVNLVVLALHILLAARIENQLVGLGIGMVGVLIGVFGSVMPVAVAHLTPWGYYALTAGADYAGNELAVRDPAYLGVAALGLLVASVFAIVTALFDRKET